MTAQTFPLPMPAVMSCPAPCAACDGRPGGCPDCVEPYDRAAMVRAGRDEMDHFTEED